MKIRILLLPAFLFADMSLRLPLIGTIQTQSGQLRPLFGVPGNLIVGDPQDPENAQRNKPNSEIEWPDGARLTLSGEEIAFRNPKGDETVLDLDPAPLLRLNLNWTQSGRHALYRNRDRIEIYLIPGGAR